MPKRTIDTAIWADRRVADLSPHAQLVFVRLVTGPETIQCGATCVHPKTVASDLNMTRDEADVATAQLVASGLVRAYDDDWLWMPRWMEHQVHARNFIASARASTKSLPDSLKKAARREIDRLFGERKAVDNSTDGPDDGERAANSVRRTTDTHRTTNDAPSRQDAKPLSKGSPSLAQGFGNPLRAVSESVTETETETETGSGLSFGQTDLTHGHQAENAAPSSAAAGAAAGAHEVTAEEITNVVSLTIATAHQEPTPDPAKQAERDAIAAEIERRRKAKYAAEATA